MKSTDNRLLGKSIIVTGGAGLLGQEHASAILESSGIPILIDLDNTKLTQVVNALKTKFEVDVYSYRCDITDEPQVNEVFGEIEGRFGESLLGLVNNAAVNPKVEDGNHAFTRLENLSRLEWHTSLDVGLYGTILCSREFAKIIKNLNTTGSIVNIASDHGLISPKQSLYEITGIPESDQPVKPITYTIVKHAMIGVTRYLATYWALDKIRVNTLCPGGVYDNQPEEFLRRIKKEIPLGRMARADEYRGILKFLLSEESSYMTGSTVVVDGGRTIW